MASRESLYVTPQVLGSRSVPASSISELDKTGSGSLLVDGGISASGDAFNLMVSGSGSLFVDSAMLDRVQVMQSGWDLLRIKWSHLILCLHLDLTLWIFIPSRTRGLLSGHNFTITPPRPSHLFFPYGTFSQHSLLYLSPHSPPHHLFHFLVSQHLPLWSASSFTSENGSGYSLNYEWKTLYSNRGQDPSVSGQSAFDLSAKYTLLVLLVRWPVRLWLSIFLLIEFSVSDVTLLEQDRSRWLDRILQICHRHVPISGFLSSCRSSTIKIDGSFSMADITMSGSGATYLAGVQKSVEVDLSGSGKVFIDAQGQVPFFCWTSLLRMVMSCSKP